MNENINLCELLEGHEGETFYSPICGEVKFIEINLTNIHPIVTNCFNLNSNGKWDNGGEVIIFPSKDQRDWNKWAEEQRPKTPKTWNELCKVPHIYYELTRRSVTEERSAVWYKTDIGSNPIEKSALALLKIHQLIEVGYGGNITSKEWEDFSVEKFIIVPYEKDFKVDHRFKLRAFRHIAFHTAEQANEFLSYPNNRLLLKDFYMV